MPMAMAAVVLVVMVVGMVETGRIVNPPGVGNALEMYRKRL